MIRQTTKAAVAPGYRDIRLIGENVAIVRQSRGMRNNLRPVGEVTQVPRRPAETIFYRIFLPIAVTINLVLGIVILSELAPYSWKGWLEIAGGAFCCLVAGWLAAAAWSKSYWGNAMTHQVLVWRRIADTFFSWLEDAPLPAEALHRLQKSLDEVVPHRERS